MGLFQNFPYTNFHEINIDQILKIVRDMQEEWESTKNDWNSMQEFINNYFDNLDVSEEVLSALQTMASSGELSTIIDPVIVEQTSAWLASHITPTTPAVDNTLSIAGAAADAKATGDAVANLKEDYVAKNGEGEVTVANTTFFDTVWINKFNGNYIDGLLIEGSGNVPTNYRLNSNSARYNLVKTKVKPNTRYTICAKQDNNITIFRVVSATHELSVGESFDGSVLLAFTSLGTNKAIRSFTTGANDKYIYFYGMNTTTSVRPFVQICEGDITDFTTDEYNVYYGIPNDNIRISELYAGVLIRPGSSTTFDVLVYDESSREWMTHTFRRTVTTHVINSQTVTTADVWWSVWIKNSNNENIMQGNTNFIQNLNMTGHSGHVGAGHGCCVAVWTKFFADGEQFDPSTLDHEIYCSCFRMTEKVNHYLIDEASTTSSSDAIPVVENGVPVILSTEYLDAKWTINNEMVIRNRLDIKYNGVQFAQCFAGMMTGYYPFFDNIIIMNPEYILNTLTGSGENIIITNTGGTSTVLTNNSSSSWDADESILFGEKYRCMTRIIANNPNRASKLNLINASMPPNYDNRIKVYFMPCVCTESTPMIEKGEPVETFNNGDILDVMIYKKLDIAK